MDRIPSTLLEDLLAEASKHFAPRTAMVELERLRAWKSRLDLDTSFGRVMNGPHWISGASIINGSIEAHKITVPHLQAINANTGNLIVTGQLLASSDPQVGFPGALIESSGRFRIRNNSGTTVIDFNPGADPLATIGSGANAITVSQAGLVSIPAGAIAGGLTISQIGTGQIGGTYHTSASPTADPRMELSTSGIMMTNAGGTTIFQLSASAGSFTMTTGPTSLQRVLITNAGFFLMPPNQTNTANALVAIDQSGFILRSATGGARIQLTQSGLAAFDSNGQTVSIGSDGRFELMSSTSGARVVLKANAGSASQNGVFLYNSVNTNVIALRADGSGFLGTNAITWDNGGNVSVNGARLTDNSVNGAKISSAAITATHIATDAVESGAIKAGAVTAAKLAADSVTADKIASNAVTTVKIAANAVTANKISVTSLQSIQQNTGSLTTGSDAELAIEVPAGYTTQGRIIFKGSGTDRFQITGTNNDQWVGTYSGNLNLRLPNAYARVRVVDVNGNPGFAFTHEGRFEVKYGGLEFLASNVATPGTVHHKLAIYNQSGTRIGWIPVYNSL